MLRYSTRIAGRCRSRFLASTPVTTAPQNNYCSTTAIEEKYLKPFSSVPAPARLPIIGHLHLFSKRGPYSFEKLYDAYAELYRQHGPIVRLDLGINMLLLFRPEDIRKLYSLDNKYPQRPLFEALRHYRLKRKDLYSSGGLISENGEEWWRLRKSVKFMLKPGISKSYFPHYEQVADDFIRFVDQKRDPNGIIPDFLQVLYRYTEEGVGLVCFGKRLGLLNTESDLSTEFSEKLTQAADDSMKAMADSLLGFPWWKIYPTPNYRKLVRAQDFFQSFAAKCAEEAARKLKDPEYKDDGKLYFFKCMLKENLKPTDMSLLMTEIFSSGIDATGNALGFALYNLTKKPEVQEKLYQDIKRQSSTGLTLDSIQKMEYLKAFIQESHRLTPATGGLARILQKPAVFSEYEIPAKVLCVGLLPIICKQQEYFSNPLEFQPERWLNKGGEFVRNCHPFAVKPFSHGLRMCVGKQFAQQEIKLCIIKLIQKFRLEYDGPEIGTIMRLSLVPDKPLNFKFVPRKD